mmetsp:Transcript_25577/g.44618  ORF Transcript_25577/g.44618 Transcript_25577/m.44618 type:complete len:295 (-) Transcript_25577:142-1026(-)
MAGEESPSCCSCFIVFYRRLRRRDLRQLHPLESRATLEINSEKNETKKDPATFIRGTDLSVEAQGALSNLSRELIKLQTADTQNLKPKEGEALVFTPDSVSPSHKLEDYQSLFNSAVAEFQSIQEREFSPIPLDNTVNEIGGFNSFSINSEPNFKTEVNSFEQDQMVLFMNQSSERFSVAAIKDQLDQAFEEQPRTSLSLKFKQLPLDPFEYENKPELPDVKLNHEKFNQIFRAPAVKGRLRLKPITPEQFMRRARLPTTKNSPVYENVLDDLKKELAEAEDEKLSGGSPSPGP